MPINESESKVTNVITPVDNRIDTSNAVYTAIPIPHNPENTPRDQDKNVEDMTACSTARDRNDKDEHELSKTLTLNEMNDNNTELQNHVLNLKNSNKRLTLIKEEQEKQSKSFQKDLGTMSSQMNRMKAILQSYE